MHAASESHPAHGPGLPLVGLGALALATLALVASVRLGGLPAQAQDDAPATATRSLRFDDQPDGSLRVSDATDGALVERIEGEAGFVRGTLRGLARERKRAGIGADVPFELVARANGRLALLDTATGRRIDLSSFGPTNAGAFARLLREDKTP